MAKKKLTLKKDGTLRKIGLSQIKKFKRATSSKKKISESKVVAIKRAFGAGGKRAGSGRPKKTYKYGVPVAQYRKQIARRKAMLQEFRRQQSGELKKKGFTTEEVQQLRQRKAIREPLPTRLKTTSPADEDLAFRKYLAKNHVSPTTQAILNKLRHTQLKSERDDVEQQRRLREKKMVESAGVILNTPYIFNKHQLDTTGVDSDDNILMAPNTFKANDADNLLKQNKLNILQTSEAGNTLKF